MGKGIGLASFIIAIITCILDFLVFPPLIWNAMGASSYSEPSVIAAASMGLVILFLAIIGLILGIIGCAKDDPKTFATIGLILSVLCLIFVLGAIALGARAVWG